MMSLMAILVIQLVVARSLGTECSPWVESVDSSNLFRMAPWAKDGLVLVVPFSHGDALRRAVISARAAGFGPLVLGLSRSKALAKLRAHRIDGALVVILKNPNVVFKGVPDVACSSPDLDVISLASADADSKSCVGDWFESFDTSSEEYCERYHERVLALFARQRTERADRVASAGNNTIDVHCLFIS